MDGDRWIVVPRWDEFQHRDMARSSVPPWIKNMTRLLHDEDYLALSLMQRGILHGIWLMYASHRRVLSESEARRELVRSAAEARRWRDTIVSLSDAGYIVIVAGRPARYLAGNPAGLEVETETEVLGSSSVQLSKAVTELDQAVTIDPTTAPAGNGTAPDHQLEEIAALIDATLPDWQP